MSPPQKKSYVAVVTLSSSEHDLAINGVLTEEASEDEIMGWVLIQYAWRSYEEGPWTQRQSQRETLSQVGSPTGASLSQGRLTTAATTCHQETGSQAHPCVGLEFPGPEPGGRTLCCFNPATSQWPCGLLHTRVRGRAAFSGWPSQGGAFSSSCLLPHNSKGRRLLS